MAWVYIPSWLYTLFYSFGLDWMYGLAKEKICEGYNLAKVKIPQLVRAEIKFLMNAPNEVKSVEKKLKEIMSDLKKTDFIRDKEAELDGWVSELRRLAFVVDDFIEVFNNTKTTYNGYDVFKRIMESSHQIKTIHKLMKEVDDFNRKYAELSGEKPEFSERSREDGEASNPLREKGGPSTETKEDDIVGFKEEEHKLETWLTQDDQRGWRVIVSIWGTGGVGKTSLAHKIYKNSSVTSKFECVAWATVSQKCDVKDIWVAILEQIGNLTEVEKEEKTEHIDIVRKKVHACLKERDYLIILDDVWQGRDFDELMKAFPESPEKKCRILVTSRSKEVGGGATHPLHLRSLNDKEDMELFLKKVYQWAPAKIQSVSEEQKYLARKILQFCEGLPMAIVILGGILRFKDETDEWRKLSERAQLELEESVGIQKVIALSYIDLPYNLRSCFLYFSLFPRGSMIDCDKLIRLWLAEGFLEQQGQNDDPMEYVAERCLDGLIQRGMIQVVQHKSNGEQPQICCTHDRIQDFAKQEAEKAQFSSIFREQPLPSVEGFRRIAIHHKNTQDQIPGTSSSVLLRSKHLISYLDASRYNRFPNHVHSLLCFSEKPQFGDEQFPLLRVVDLEGAEKIKKLPSAIEKLILLRYLSLRGTGVTVIPRWIASLHNLQTLDAPKSKIPIEALTLRKLRYLFAASFYGPSSTTRLCAIGLLKHLHTLELDTTDWIIGGLDELTNLRVLRLHCGEDSVFRLNGGEDEDDVFGAVAMLTRLESLYLSLKKGGSLTSSSSQHTDVARPMHSLSFSSHSNLDEMTLKGTLVKLPAKLNDFPNWIKYLWLETYVDNDMDPFCTVQRLHSLKKLCLRLFKANDEVKSKTTCCADGFPKLEYLYVSVDFLIGGGAPLEWTVEEGALRNLKVLHIEGNEDFGWLGRLPVGLKHVRTLKELIMTRCSDVRGELARKVGPSWEEVKDMQSLSFKFLDETNVKP